MKCIKDHETMISRFEDVNDVACWHLLDGFCNRKKNIATELCELYIQLVQFEFKRRNYNGNDNR